MNRFVTKILLLAAAAAPYVACAKASEPATAVHSEEPGLSDTYIGDRKIYLQFKEGLTAADGGDYPTAYSKWLPLAQAGVPVAQYNIGYLYSRGLGTGQDHKLALNWFSRAADQGLPQAQFRVALAYLTGEGVAQDDALGFQFCQQAANAGVHYADYVLGRLYQTGRGVFKDPVQAVNRYRKAAGNGIPGAQLNLGLMYLAGDGVSKDYQEAARWVRQAAEQGYAPAEFSMGNLYRAGWGVIQNFEQALGWYLQAAQQGHAQALTSVGLLYANGQGAPRNAPVGALFLLLADKAGDSNAARYVHNAKNSLSVAQFEQLRQIAEQWRPGMPLPQEYQQLARLETEPAPPLVANLKPIIVPTPEYPASARRRQQEGEVTVYAVIAPSGQVKSVKVAQSSGAPDLDLAAAAAAWSASFEPHMEHGKASTAAVLIPYRFKLDEAQAPIRRPAGISMTRTDSRSLGERIKANIVFEVPPDWRRNDPAEYSVTLFPDGSVRTVDLLSSSGLPGFDAAVRRAIEKSQPYPMTDLVGSPPRFVLRSRPLN
jgi:TonB family protein